MLGTSEIVAFVATRDRVRARAFYEGVLGLRVTHEDDFALVLDANGTMVRVTPVPSHTPVPYTVLGWSVADIAGTARGMRERGVVFERFPGMDQDELGIWSAPGGARVAWFKDPDGNVLSLTQY